jgi:hypothetical protein
METSGISPPAEKHFTDSPLLSFSKFKSRWKDSDSSKITLYLEIAYREEQCKSHFIRVLGIDGFFLVQNNYQSVSPNPIV